MMGAYTALPSADEVRIGPAGTSALSPHHPAPPYPTFGASAPKF